MRLKLEVTALVCDRYGVSNKVAVAIASTILQDVRLIHESDMSLVIDKNKIRREKAHTRNILQCDSDIIVRGLYFDDRKDDTLVMETMHEKRFAES